ncbi:uncharacterized protein TNIN_135391 [Trichonephila inaurata madagascariensis]|uniref:Uncharacterized protein n=1 Tax=Trichonephila inaurata madagascariensis TaxID=2747483 RepID=A0A8X6IBS8_9ARAC|nr:uncharacterized protein TNIN_135391 [Trichonephila inaurata madagascariensis]
MNFLNVVHSFGVFEQKNKNRPYVSNILMSSIFQNHPKRSLWEKVPPPKKKEDVLKECHDLTGKNNCEHEAKIEGCCCRCCTCRGCPTCRKEYCHPCSFSYGRAGAATKCKLCRVPFPLNIDKDQPCEKHPSGCYFIPNPED